MQNPYQRHPRIHVPASRQHGFSLLGIIIFAIVSLGLASYFLLAKSFNAYNLGNADAGRAGTILSQASAIQGGFNVLLSRGIAPDQILMDATAGVGIYNADAGSTVPQLVDPSAVINPAPGNGFWIYRGAALQNTGVGSGAASYALMVAGLTATTCLAIDSILHGSQSIPAVALPADSFRSASASLSSPNDFSAPVDLSPFVAVKGWNKGCVITNDGVIIFFQVLLPR